MEPSTLKLKVTYLVVALDKTKQNIDRNYLKLLLDNNNEVPSKTVCSVSTDDNVKILKELHNEFLNYDYGYVYKTLAGFRIIDNTCEVCYIATMNYIPDFYKSGNVYTLNEIQDRNILIEEYYGEIFAKFGSRSFR